MHEQEECRNANASRWDNAVATHVYDDIAFVGAPKDGPMLDDLWRIELNHNPTWQAMSPGGRKPSPRCSHTAVAMGSNIVFHGGAGKEFGCPLTHHIGDACLPMYCVCLP